MGKGVRMNASTKQNANSRISTEVVLNATDEKISKIIRVNKFIKHQDFKVKLNIVYQDNTITKELQKNGKVSCGKRTRHFNIK